MEKETLNEALEKTFSSIREFKDFKNNLRSLYFNLNRIFPIDISLIILTKILNFDLSFLNKILLPLENKNFLQPFITQKGGCTYSYIIHPKTKKKISIQSKTARKIIIKYITNLLYHLD